MLIFILIDIFDNQYLQNIFIVEQKLEWSDTLVRSQPTDKITPSLLKKFSGISLQPLNAIQIALYFS